MNEIWKSKKTEDLKVRTINKQGKEKKKDEIRKMEAGGRVK